MGWFRKDPPAGPDFSEIDSREKAEALVVRGELTPMLLLPEMFGGEPVPHNIAFVPPFAAQLKHSADVDIVRPLAEEGKISRYNVEPRYVGSSFVPVVLKLVAHDPGKFVQTIRIWGEGLKDD